MNPSLRDSATPPEVQTIASSAPPRCGSRQCGLAVVKDAFGLEFDGCLPLKRIKNAMTGIRGYWQMGKRAKSGSALLAGQLPESWSDLPEQAAEKVLVNHSTHQGKASALPIKMVDKIWWHFSAANDALKCIALARLCLQRQG